MSARGLFKATRNVAKPVMTDLLDGEAVYSTEAPRKKDDFYATPPEPTRAIINAERQRLMAFPLIWEPSCGDGAMSRELAREGFEVFNSDLVDRGVEAQIKSFYDFSSPPADAIMTNPPFVECNTGAWIRHALYALKVKYMALLLPFNWPGAESRAGLWAEHPPARVYLMRWRIDFTGAGAPPMLNAWFVWDGECLAEETRLLMLSRFDAQQQGFDL